MTGKTVGIIVVVLLIIVGAWYFFSQQHGAAPMQPAPTTTNTSTTTTTTTTTTTNGVTVAYTDNGFSPATITIAQGESVTWINQSSENLWVASDPHPVHSGYDGTTLSQHCAPGYAGPAPFDECTAVPAGGSFTFVFGKVGTWGYHNHADDGVRGTVIVTAPTSTSAGVNVNVQ